MVVNGFIEPIAKELLLEYAIELSRPTQPRDGRSGHRSREGSLPDH